MKRNDKIIEAFLVYKSLIKAGWFCLMGAWDVLHQSTMCLQASKC